MKHLVGKSFSIADGRYRIVDVRQLGGDAMVYAERMEAPCQAASPEAGARPGTPRAAFHYGDIAALLDAPRSA